MRSPGRTKIVSSTCNEATGTRTSSRRRRPDHPDLGRARRHWPGNAEPTSSQHEPVVETGAADAPLVDQRPRVVEVLVLADEGLDLGVDDHLGGRLVGEHLARLGHTRVGIISGPRWASTGIDRLEGCIAALNGAGIDVPAPYVREEGFDPAAGRRGAEALLSLPEPPTAIFAANDAIIAAETGDCETAEALFQPFVDVDDATVQVRRVRNYLRWGRPADAAAILSNWSGRAEAFMFWPYASIAWRMLDDKRWQWLEGDERFVGVYDIADRLPPLEPLDPLIPPEPLEPPVFPPWLPLRERSFWFRDSSSPSRFSSP